MSSQKSIIPPTVQSELHSQSIQFDIGIILEMFYAAEEPQSWQHQSFRWRILRSTMHWIFDAALSARNVTGKIELNITALHNIISIIIIISSSSSSSSSSSNNKWCMSRGRSIASRQLRGSKSAASFSPRRFDASPRFCLILNVMTSKSRYDIIIYNFHPFIFRKYVKTKIHLCIKQRFGCKLNVFGVCVASWII